MGNRLLQKTMGFSDFYGNCFYFSLHRENMIPRKSNDPGTGKCIVFVHLLNDFVMPCSVDPQKVKSNI